MKNPFKVISQWWFRRKLKSIQQLLLRLDWYMIKAGLARHERRQFWREFIHNRKLRKETIDFIREETIR